MTRNLLPMHHTPVDTTDHRLITEVGAREIYDRIQKMQHGSGRLVVILQAEWKGYLRWARNRVSLASDERQIYVSIMRNNINGMGVVQTNQIDDASLRAAVNAAERKMSLGLGTNEKPYDGLLFTPPLLPAPETTIWSDTTYNVTPEQRGELAQALTESAEAHQLLSAGFLQMRVGEARTYGPPSTDTGRAQLTGETMQGKGGEREAREVGYVRHTEAQCSMTVRHPKGVGSGWAGLSGYDWGVIDAKTLAKRALDKCLTSLNPVAIEPGRYTVILEPQAVASLAAELVRVLGNRSSNENLGKPGVFSLDVDQALGIRRTKLGLKVIDERISLTHNPMDERLGVLPSLGLGPVTWIEHGILRNLGYGRDDSPETYSLGMLNENLPVVATGSYQMSGGDTSVEEMIATTQRGLLVSRFSNVRQVPEGGLSCLLTGLTRDGLWLVENGKISKAVKNMRFTDSPLFMLNQVEQLGMPVPVFNPQGYGLRPVIVPTIKANDFAFTATIDAI